MTAPTPPSPAPTDPPLAPGKQRKRLKPWQYILIGASIPVVLLLAFLALTPLLFGALMGGAGSTGPGESEYVVGRMELAQGVTLPGTIEPTQRLDLSFSSRGEVTHVAVAVGDAVAPGSVLSTIDDADLRAAVTDARAEADAAWKDYQDARRSGQSAAVSAMRSAHAVKAQALKDAEAALEKATLTSTIDGVVAAVNVQPGQVAGEAGGGPPGGTVAGDASGQADVVVISRTFQVKASVSGGERSRLAKGMEAIVTSSSSPTPLRGTVTALGVVAETAPSGDKPSAASFPLVVTLEGQPENVFAGSPATIEVLAEAKGGPVLAVPEEALMERTSNTDGSVLLRRGSDVVPTPVKLGATTGGMVEVVSGLTEGDVVLFFPAQGVTGPDGPAGPGVVSGGSAREAEPPR